MEEHEEEHELELYGDADIASFVGTVPKWLIVTYVILPIWGLFWLYFFWNGSYGWLDPGYWNQLQRAANTTFPSINQENTSPEKIIQKG